MEELVQMGGATYPANHLNLNFLGRPRQACTPISQSVMTKQIRSVSGAAGPASGRLTGLLAVIEGLLTV